MASKLDYARIAIGMKHVTRCRLEQLFMLTNFMLSAMNMLYVMFCFILRNDKTTAKEFI